MIEIKTNMGYCRDATDVLNKIKDVHKVFKERGKISCRFSSLDENGSKETESEDVEYLDDVKLFLIALTTDNIGKEERIDLNQKRAKEKGIKHYYLFKGWYGNLEENEIIDFAENL